MLRPIGSTAKPRKTAMTSITGARNAQPHPRQRDDIFLGQRLDAVGDRLQDAERADAIGAEPILNAAQALALKHGGEGEDAGEGATMPILRAPCNEAG
jgi:hypothetical protein